MHTYQKQGNNWQVVFKTSAGTTVIGSSTYSTYTNEVDAAARVSYLNGGSLAYSSTAATHMAFQ